MDRLQPPLTDSPPNGDADATPDQRIPARRVPVDRAPARGVVRPNHPRYRITRRGWIVFTGLPVGVIVLIAWVMGGDDSGLGIDGVSPDAVVSAEQLSELTASVDFGRDVAPDRVSASLDGGEVPVSVDGTKAVVDLSGVDDGEHQLRIRWSGFVPMSGESASTSFVVDATAPTIELVGPTQPVPPLDPVTVRLAVDDSDAIYQIDGRDVTPSDDGMLSIDFDRPPSSSLGVVATDPAGNQNTLDVRIQLALPGVAGGPPIRGVHATGYTWATPELKDPIMQMIAEGRINTVELDLKDEGGDIWYATEVPLASEIGAVTQLYDLEAAVDELHELGVRVIGRIVNFRDPRMAEWAVETGQMDLVVQSLDGSALGKYGGFTNPYSEVVREYNIAIAEEAARLGVDDVMFDYVRRPDENIDLMVFPGQDRSPEDAIVDFLADSQKRVNAAGARLGAAVFGIAATRPEEIAQDIPRMSEHVDYIAPMLYPSHWGPGEYGVENPNAQPYDIIYRSLVEFAQLMEGSDAELVAWLQDFSLGVDYGQAEVRAQIDASIDAGVPDFLLWDASTTYTEAALDPQ